VLLTLCKGKLHRATVTQAELHYVGSITIAADLLAAAGIVPWERVQVVDVANGARFETYAVEGRERSGTVCVNGAAARLVQVGDPVIVIAYAQMDSAEARGLPPHHRPAERRQHRPRGSHRRADGRPGHAPGTGGGLRGAESREPGALGGEPPAHSH